MMASLLRSLLISIGVAWPLQLFFGMIGSMAVIEFLKANIISLQAALLAVNAATLGIVLTKIREISDRYGSAENFRLVRKEMVLSIQEQIALIVVSILLIGIIGGKDSPWQLPAELFPTLLLAVFVYMLLVLYDTAISVFVLLDYSP